MKRLNLISIEEAQERIDTQFIDYELETEELLLTECRGRILGEEIYSPINVPDYRRSTVDGYAVRTEDLEGASLDAPILLKLIGKSEMGYLTDLEVKPHETVYVPTGGMVPVGANAMIMQEYTEPKEDGVLFEISASELENMIDVGGDIMKDSLILRKGSLIRTQEIGAMASIGKKMVKVYKKPRVSIICTGDELISIDEDLTPGKIRDMNTITLKMIAEELGCIVVRNELVKDDFDAILKVVGDAVDESDLVVVSGGSSVGEKDVTADIFRTLEENSVFMHGIRVKPGKPTIVANIQGKPVFGLPGHPVSALNIFRIFVRRALDRIQLQKDSIPRMVRSSCQEGFVASPERDTYQMVRFTDDSMGHFVKVTGKSGMITLLTKADGYVLIRAHDNVVNTGDVFEVILFD